MREPQIQLSNLWYGRFVATAETQDLSNVLNPKYVPANNNNKRVFGTQKTYLFQVFTIVLHEPMASELLQKYSNRDDKDNYGDAQKIHAALVERWVLRADPACRPCLEDQRSQAQQILDQDNLPVPDRVQPYGV